MNSTQESMTRLDNKDLIHSISTSMLAVKWRNKAPKFDYKLKTNVNLFGVLFSYLSDNTTYLESLQENKSYTIINKSVYELIIEEGDVVFNKISN